MTSGGDTSDYDMTIDGSGAPVVADVEYVPSDRSSRLFTYRWNGSSWETPAPGAVGLPPQTNITEPTIRVDSKGRLVVAWHQFQSGVVASAVAVARYQP
jgi:hypothetical protein